jgi:hypothetical protein
MTFAWSRGWYRVSRPILPIRPAKRARGHQESDRKHRAVAQAGWGPSGRKFSNPVSPILQSLRLTENIG